MRGMTTQQENKTRGEAIRIGSRDGTFTATRSLQARMMGDAFNRMRR